MFGFLNVALGREDRTAKPMSTKAAITIIIRMAMGRLSSVVRLSRFMAA